MLAEVCRDRHDQAPGRKGRVGEERSGGGHVTDLGRAENSDTGLFNRKATERVTVVDLVQINDYRKSVAET